MKKNIFISASCIVLAACLMLVSCNATKVEQPTSPEEQEEVEVPIVSQVPVQPSGQGEEVAEETEPPEYGGTINLVSSSDVLYFDPYWPKVSSSVIQSFWFEYPGVGNWALDASTWPFTIDYCPDQFMKGQLVESWEIPDALTIIYHVRKGVHWQNKPPVNGREFTAEDIEFTFQRHLGLGSGYTEACPAMAGEPFDVIESVTATDKWTVVMKLKQPNLRIFHTMYETGRASAIVAREAVEKYGDLQDWRNAVGTGPFILKDYVSGSVVLFDKNPNYWDYDERNPENRLPYADHVQVFIIPDPTTALSALRTGKIDEISFENTTPIAWEQLERLQATNPDIKSTTRPSGNLALAMIQTKPPFNDVRVRAAVQMALNLEEMAEYYGGYSNATPVGAIGELFKGFYSPYEEWPEEVKKEYAYDPEGARELLAKAGYEKGFTTTLLIGPEQELDLAEMVKAYLSKVGIDVTLDVKDYGARMAIAFGGNLEGLAWFQAGMNSEPSLALNFYYPGIPWNVSRVNDPILTEIINKVKACLDQNEYRDLTKEADEYIIAQHLHISLVAPVRFPVWHPWLKAFNGQLSLGGSNCGALYARVWVDQKLKRELGY